MHSVRELRVMQCRRQMLYAQRSWAAWGPVFLFLGIVFWLATVHRATLGETLLPSVGSALGSLVAFILAILSLTTGSWLVIDRARGWIHWRTCGWLRGHRESFSPQRIESLQVLRRGPFCWTVALRLDHPYIPQLRLGRTRRRARAHEFAKAWAAILEIDWLDETGLRHVAAPERDGEDQGRPLPPPPEIDVETAAGVARIILPRTPESTLSAAGYLFYAIFWSLWALSVLIAKIHGAGDGPAGAWSWVEIGTITLLCAGSAAGLLMLFHAMARIAGRQVLEMRPEGWRLGRWWLGISWARRPLVLKKDRWLRRIDIPGGESGLWIPQRRHEIRLAPGLSAEALGWLHQLLTRESSRRSFIASCFPEKKLVEPERN